MKQQTYNLVMKILDSNLPEKTRDDVVRFYTLPRIVAMTSKIEDVVEPDEEVGSVSRPSAEKINEQNNPILKGTNEAMRETVKGMEEIEKRERNEHH